MKTINKDAHYSKRVEYGYYVSRRLRKGRHLDASATADKATKMLLQAGRAAEDAKRPVQEALADRDAADADLDTAAQTSRARLAGRGPTADRETPYTEIYPQGVTYYTAAPIGEEKRRYGELKRRHETHLAAKDEVRMMTVAAVDVLMAVLLDPPGSGL